MRRTTSIKFDEELLRKIKDYCFRKQISVSDFLEELAQQRMKQKPK